MYNHNRFNVVNVQTYDTCLTTTLVAIARSLEGNVLYIAPNSTVARTIKHNNFHDKKNVYVIGSDMKDYSIQQMFRGITINHVVIDDCHVHFENVLAIFYERIRGIPDYYGNEKTTVILGHKPIRMIYDPEHGVL